MASEILAKRDDAFLKMILAQIQYSSDIVKKENTPEPSHPKCENGLRN